LAYSQNAEIPPERRDTRRLRATDEMTTSVENLVRGVCPVLEVPFTEGGDVDYPGFSRVVCHVLGTGVTAVMFPGFASETHKLADEERRQLTELLLSRTRSLRDVAAVISVSEHSTELAVRATRSAVTAGADAVNVLPPHFLRPSPAAVEDHLRSVLAAAHPVPVVVQYAPAETGTALDAATLAGIAREHANLRFVKVEASPPGPLVAALAEQDPPLPALVGYGGMHLPDAVRRGAVGVQPGCSFTEVYVEIWNRYVTGRVDEARALHGQLLAYLAYWMQSVELIVAVEKLISFRRGIIASDRCRRPSRELDVEERRQVEEFMAEFARLLPSASG